jgi:hypothetical protein
MCVRRLADRSIRPMQCPDCKGDVEQDQDGGWLNSWCVCENGPKVLVCRDCGEEQVQ